MAESIIDHRPVQRLYGFWILSIIVTAGLLALAYFLQATTPLRTDISYIPLISCIFIAVALAVLAVLFKRIFRQAPIAWMLCTGIAILGFIVALHYGWSWWWLSWWFVSGLLELILGPYLHIQ